MKRILLLLVLAIAFVAVGCASGIRVSVNEKSELFTIRPLKDVDLTHPATVLFVNRSTGVWQKCLVFQRYYNLDQLLERDLVTGEFKLKVTPVGYFKIKPALDGQHVMEATRHIGFFVPRHDYTILCFLEGFDGKVIKMETAFLTVPVRAEPERRYYYSILGTQVEEYVNYVHYLPTYYSGYGGTNNTIGLTINVNELLKRLIHGLTGRADRELEPEEETEAEKSPYLNPKFPKLPAKPDSTK